jgi:hypothetical protein
LEDGTAGGREQARAGFRTSGPVHPGIAGARCILLLLRILKTFGTNPATAQSSPTLRDRRRNAHLLPPHAILPMSDKARGGRAVYVIDVIIITYLTNRVNPIPEGTALQNVLDSSA